MKCDEIMSLEAGQELDLLISKNVFGHSVDEWNKQFFNNNTLYSTRISCAWLVKEKMCGYMLDNPQVYLSFVNHLGAMPSDIIFNLSPLRICRAALLAVTQPI